MNKRKYLIYNFFFLILRQIIIFISGFLVIRFLLKNLGIDGYATYIVLFSFVSVLSFIYSSISITSIRNFSHAIALNDLKYQKILFNNNLIFNFALGCLLLLFFGVFGLFSIENFLKISDQYKSISSKVFILILFCYVISIQCLTFESFLKAKEKMVAYSIISIIDSIFKLLSSIILIYMPFENLQNYSILLFFFSVCTFTLYYTMTKKIDRSLELNFKFFNLFFLKKNLSFLKWSLFGQFSSVIRNQGIILLFNQFFNSTIVISRSISMQLSNSINLITENLNINFNPFLIKKFYKTDSKKLSKSLILLSKISFLLTYLFALPLLIETKFILFFMFDNLSQHLIFFTKLAIIDTLILSSAIPISNIARAPAKMKIYELTLGSIQILIFILSFFFIYFDYIPSTVFVISIFGNLIMWILRLTITSKLINFDLLIYLKEFLFFIIKIIIISILLVSIFQNYINVGYLNSFLVIFVSFIINILIAIFFLRKDLLNISFFK